MTKILNSTQDNNPIKKQGEIIGPAPNTIIDTTGGVVIQIREKDLELILMKYMQKIIQISSWQLPFGIFLTLIITVLSVDK